MTADPYEAGDGEYKKEKEKLERKSKHNYEILKTRGKKSTTTAPTKIY